MFSTMPSTGTFNASIWNRLTPLRASMRATGCGVLTMMAPLNGTACTSCRWISPVPGGMSTSMMSSSPQSASLNSWSKALLAMGPRQAMAWLGSAKKPMLSSCTP